MLAQDISGLASGLYEIEFSDGSGCQSSALQVYINQPDTVFIENITVFMLADFLRSHDAKFLWPAHFFGRRREYAHIERLSNLDKLPPFGFKIACFPVKIKDAGAAWARVAAIL